MRNIILNFVRIVSYITICNALCVLYDYTNNEIYVQKQNLQTTKLLALLKNIMHHCPWVYFDHIPRYT